MNTHLRLAAVVLAALALSACALGGGKTPSTIYAPEHRVQPDPAWPSVRWQLGTTRPSAARMIDSTRIVVSPVPGELQVYKGATWARTPTEMVEDGVLRLLEDSGKIPAVARQGSGIAADYRLVMDIRRFQSEYAVATLPSAVVEVSAQLVHTHDQAVVGSQVFRHARPATGTDVALVADAFSHALGASVRDIAGWVLVTGQAHQGRRPGATP